jgi:hypothetical protein
MTSHGFTPLDCCDRAADLLRRAVAIEMMRWLERRALAELEKMGVTP